MKHLKMVQTTGIKIRETGMPGKGTRFEMTVPSGAYRMNTDTDLKGG